MLQNFFVQLDKKSSVLCINEVSSNFIHKGAELSDSWSGEPL